MHQQSMTVYSGHTASQQAARSRYRLDLEELSDHDLLERIARRRRERALKKAALLQQ